MNELLEKVQELYNEHGFMTGEEFLEITNHDMELYNVYLKYIDGYIMPAIAEKIENRIAELKAYKAERGWA